MQPPRLRGNSVSTSLNGAVKVVSIEGNYGAFATLRENGSVITRGSNEGGGDSSRVAESLDGTIPVTTIGESLNAFAAIRADGSVICWGLLDIESEFARVKNRLSFGVEQIVGADSTFSALPDNGSVVFWGTPGNAH